MTGKRIVEAIHALGTGSGERDEQIADIMDRLEKVEEKTAIAHVFRGSVETADDLPDDANVGDVYDVKANGANYVWTGTEWDAFGEDLNLISNDAIDDLFPTGGLA